MWLRLANAGHPDVQIAGTHLNDLRGERDPRRIMTNHRPMRQATATKLVQTAEEVVRLDVAAVEPPRSQVINAMIVYERDVLRDVTWQP